MSHHFLQLQVRDAAATSETRIGEKFAILTKFQKVSAHFPNNLIMSIILNLFGQTFYAVGQIFIIVSGQILMFGSHWLLLLGHLKREDVGKVLRRMQNNSS